jgi:hypothetical protein
MDIIRGPHLSEYLCTFGSARAARSTIHYAYPKYMDHFRRFPGALRSCQLRSLATSLLYHQPSLVGVTLRNFDPALNHIDRWCSFVFEGQSTYDPNEATSCRLHSIRLHVLPHR